MHLQLLTSAPAVSARADLPRKGSEEKSSAFEITTILISRSKAQSCASGEVCQQDPKGCFTTHAKAVGKPAAKPPPKAITPLGQAAAAKPPPAAVTSKPPPGTAGGAWQAPAKGKAPPTAAEREQQAAPRSPPLSAADWSTLTSKEGVLAKTSEVWRLDPNSAEGFDCHVSSYYCVSADWGVSHPQCVSSIMLKDDSRQSHRWTCVHCRSNHPEYADHKTAEEGIVHWWKHHCHPACWAWCDKATELGVTTPEMCKAVSTLTSLWSLCRPALRFICSPMRKPSSLWDAKQRRITS